METPNITRNMHKAEAYMDPACRDGRITGIWQEIIGALKIYEKIEIYDGELLQVWKWKINC